MPLTWFSTPAFANDKSQHDRQIQFGRERFVSEQTPDQTVRTALVVNNIDQYNLTHFFSHCLKNAHALKVSSMVTVYRGQTRMQDGPCHSRT
jgi:hypothetical protein